MPDDAIQDQPLAPKRIMFRRIGPIALDFCFNTLSGTPNHSIRFKTAVTTIHSATLHRLHATNGCLWEPSWAIIVPGPAYVQVGKMGWGALIGQIDVNRKQTPHDAHLTGASVPNPSDGPPAAQPGEEPSGLDRGIEDDALSEPPPWAAPLRDMYQQVVDEPLPDFLSDLLSRLDRDER